MWSCRTWIQTLPIISKLLPSILMDQEESWKETDAQVWTIFVTLKWDCLRVWTEHIDRHVLGLSCRTAQTHMLSSVCGIHLRRSEKNDPLIRNLNHKSWISGILDFLQGPRAPIAFARELWTGCSPVRELSCLQGWPLSCVIFEQKKPYYIL